MSSMDPEQLEERLRQAAAHFRYPPTSPIASVVMKRLPRPAAPRWTWAVVAVLVMLAALLLVPPARAAVIDFIQIGVVRIFRTEPVPAPVSTPALQAPLTATPLATSSAQAPVTATPSSGLQDLAGETTLADAQSNTGFSVLIPHYPPDLGKPDRIYLQDMGGSLLLLVWLQPDGSGHVRMSLQEIAAGSWALAKFGPQTLQEVTVNGHKGVWATGPYLLETRNHEYDTRRLVAGNSLIWTQGNVTYRLESSLSLDEALKVAESLAPLP